MEIRKYFKLNDNLKTMIVKMWRVIICVKQLKGDQANNCQPRTQLS